MSKIIKRDGSEANFSKMNVYNAISNANNMVRIEDRFTNDEIKAMTKDIENVVKNETHSVNASDIQVMVENAIIKAGKADVAREYITYRYEKELARRKNTTDDELRTLLDGTNEEIIQENANKNPELNSTLRDYMAGIQSKDYSKRYLIPEDIYKAHKDGIGHFHDMDYFAAHEHNCFSGDTEVITSNGVMKFNEMKDGSTIFTLTKDGNWKKAIVKNYGKQQLFKYEFYNTKKALAKTIYATENHRWYLDNGTVTTNLKIGDKLVKAPSIYDQDNDYEKFDDTQKLLWCKGFALGDGTVEYDRNNTRIRLCGNRKNEYIDRFNVTGCSIRTQKIENDHFVAVLNYKKEIPEFRNVDDIKAFFNGLYCADGRMAKDANSERRIHRIQSSNKDIIEFIRKYAPVAGLYITRELDLTNQKTGYIEKRPYTILFSFNPNMHNHYKVLSKEKYKVDDVWCLEVEDEHNFVLPNGIVTGNCDLLNIEDMLQNGTCINKVKIDKPSTFSTASNITAQIIAQVASSQYGGQTISLAHLAPFVEETRKTFREEHKKLEEKLTKEEFDAFIEEETRKDIYKGCKTLLYQINTLMTVNGQAPFVTVCMYLNEAKNEKEKEDLAIVIEETIKRRMKGVKDETGHYVGIAFPKVIYYLQEDNYKPGTKYYYLTELAAKCTADKQVPDYMSEKVMKELHNGNAFPTMGAAVGKETVTIKIEDEIYYNIQISKAASLVRNKCSRKGEQHGKFTYDVSYRGQCGVYKITHKPTNKFYIGSSKDIGRRFSEHRTSIKYKGTLGDSYFIGDYDKDNYEFSVLTICDIDSLYETESIVYKKEANDLCVNMKDPIIRGNHGHLNSNKGYHDVPQHYHQFYKKIDDADVQILAGNQFVPIRGVIINNAYTPLKLYKVTHEFGSVTITEDHPLHTQRGRVECANLTTNDSVILCDTKEYSKILNIEKVEKEATYDFETDCDMFNMSGIVSHNCRSTLSDVKVSKDDPWKVVTKGGVPKYYGRFNQGVFTLNLPDIALCSKKDMEKFWLLLDQRMELAHRALRLRHERLRGVKSDVAPILWQHGALARLDKHETIDKLLFNGYSTISVGYMGLHETVYYLTGKNYWEDEDTMKLAQDILNKMNEKCEQWKAVEHIGYSIYGTPAENLVGKFAKALKKRHGIVPGVSDREFITNSYHIPVWVEMDAFTKLEYESKLQKLSKGGAISYVEMGDLRNNVDAILSVMEYIYNNIGYAELNGSTDRCQCGFEGRIELIDNGEGKLIWKCPACGNTDKARMTIIRRVCGYLLNSNDCCQARLHDIKNRVEHI